MKFQNEYLKVITLKSSADAEVLATPHYSASAFLSNLIFVTEIQKSTKVYFPDCYETRLFNQTLAIRNRAPIDTRVRKIPFELEGPRAAGFFVFLKHIKKSR